jgi:hypothetical protein
MPDPVELPAFIREAVTCDICGLLFARIVMCSTCRERRDAVRRVLEGLAQFSTDRTIHTNDLRGGLAALENS